MTDNELTEKLGQCVADAYLLLNDAILKNPEINDQFRETVRNGRIDIYEKFAPLIKILNGKEENLREQLSDKAFISFVGKFDDIGAITERVEDFSETIDEVDDAYIDFALLQNLIVILTEYDLFVSEFPPYLLEMTGL
ncbi:MAG: hypothetical protein ACOXZK_01070 [Bacteroidales bacterium]|jgi:hypothetical protein|nr:hypothetical protein [Bacteroidales bacterium]